MVAVEPQSTSAFYHFHGTRIDGLRRLVCTLLAAKDKPSLSKSEKTAIIQQIACVEEPYTTGDVNFSRVQSDDIRRLLAIGENLEFEALGPYLSDYLSYQGVISRDNLTPVDAIGLVVAASLRKIFPDALTVSFYDDYNVVCQKSFSEINQDVQDTSQKLAAQLQKNEIFFMSIPFIWI